ncbi:MAG TPA: DUF1501 domain-containing protein [Caulobacteraceae bacterium]|jgi:uncharacterized protein (DUF1501 family)|nr:DUF1501 domain-containing protein [Caulobacteraceae bacterium]
MTALALTRRAALAGVGLTVELVAGRAFAAVDHQLAKRKLVVVICRGGLDGLSLSPPVGDPDYAGLRGAIAIPPFGADGGALRLDDTFGLHPALTKIHALALAGEARIAPAIATPDRERSHFEAQDVLESGAARVYSTSSGWLNRALAAMGPEGKAISVGPTAPLILHGPREAASWSPGGLAQRDQRLPGILQDLYAHDPLLGPALAEGLATQAMARTALADAAAASAAMQSANPAPGLLQAARIGADLAGFMVQPGGFQIAAVSIDNFDTHANQGAAKGQLATRLAYVDAFFDGLRTGLGESWRASLVVMATEFGRTARVNGTGGTDHGTASTALVLGGALKRGGIIGDWPSLRQASLFENRDTYPTLDMRALFKGVLRDHLGLERATLDAKVFPDSARVAPVTGLV